MIKNIKNEITKENFNCGGWLDDVTYTCYIKISDKLKESLKDIIKDDEVTFMAEYWEDEKSCHYLLMFEDETICINDKVECEYLNDIFMVYLQTA